MRTIAVAACVLSLTSACTGLITEPGGDEAGSGGTSGTAGPGVANAALSSLRRMTPEQYENSVRDLFAAPDLTFSLDEDTGEAVSRLAAEKLNAAAEHVVESQASWGEPIFPCDTSGSGSDACVDQFIREFGKRAFRRPVDDEQFAWLRGTYDKARVEHGFRDSLFVVLQVMLQSPQFIYFLEEGKEPSGKIAPGVRPLTGYERATRLSYFLWNTTPDTELLAAAESGELDDPAGVREHAERLLADDRARRSVVRFFSDWLELDGTTLHDSLEAVQKESALFPEDAPELRAAMRTEVEALVEKVVFEGDGKLTTLLTTNEAYVNGPLAALYGASGPTGAEFEWITLPAAERSGLFTRAAFATVYSGSEVKSPIRRAAFILENALCVHLGEPPPNANDTPVTGGAVEENGQVVHKTVRQDVLAKTSGDGCSGCHQILNPIGFAFDNYDALGRFHVEEPPDLPVDASGNLPLFEGEELVGTTPVNGGVEMSQALADSAALGRCFAEKWFERGLARLPGDEDEHSIETLVASLNDSGTVRDLILSLVVSDAFLHVRREAL